MKLLNIHVYMYAIIFFLKFMTIIFHIVFLHHFFFFFFHYPPSFFSLLFFIHLSLCPVGWGFRIH